MKAAKGRDVQQFLKEEVVTRLEKGEHVEPGTAMRMRFVLAWKVDPDTPGGKKGKARLVVLGFEDPSLGQEEVSAPTLNKRSKQLLMQVAAQQRRTLKKGDVTAAFLQGRPLTTRKYAIAPPELAEAMGLPPGEKVV